jgi:2-succinyl-5-enolpyruvyl-6-hydroxy-3-cyclohexene-1-carboxylate synthase
MTPQLPNPSGGVSPAAEFSAVLLAELVRLGVRDIVLSPGSRSQSLALAAAALEKAGRVRVRVRIDERVGGFLALGLAVEERTPVVVIVTSGTAVANVHPAMLEAHHSGVPLIIITADRPVELRGIGANQATVQPGIFGEAARRTFDVEAPTGAPGERAAAAALAAQILDAAANPSRPGPVHVNLALADPLSGPLPVDVPWGEVDTDQVARGHAVPRGESLILAYEPGTIVVAGHAAGPEAEAVARALGAPLLAEVSSGAHFGPNLVVAYRDLLDRANFGDRVERVIVFGHPTLSRQVPALIQRPGVETIVVRSHGADDYNPGHAVRTFVDVVHVAGEPDDSPTARSWLGRWVMTSRTQLEQHNAPPIDIAISNEPADQAAFSRAVLKSIRESVSRRTLVEAVWRMTWPHDRLVLGASRLIREADQVVTGKKISVHANRGLAGIDGTIATGVGIALASQDSDGVSAAGVTRVLLGDLALLHDAGAMLFGVGEPRPRIQVIVGNDDGGTIFDGLEVATLADPDAFDRVQLTPQLIAMEQLALAYGWEYVLVTSRGELEGALTPGEYPTLIEVRLER